MRTLVACAVLGGCGFNVAATGDAHPQTDAALSDSSAIDAAIDSAVPTTWSAPVLVPLGGSVGGDDDPTLTADRLVLYFNRDGDIYACKRTAIGQPWSTPELVTSLSTGYVETTPEISGDGLTIYFSSTRPPSQGYDLWYSTRQMRDMDWLVPGQVVSASSSAEDSAGTPSNDLMTLTLNSSRGGLGEDLYLAKRTMPSGTWSAPLALTALNSAGNDYGPMMTDDKKQIFWDSDVTGAGDLYTATQTSTGQFSAPTAITELDTASVEADPWISPDGRYMMFVSNRSGAFAMYESTR